MSQKSNHITLPPHISLAAKSPQTPNVTTTPSAPSTSEQPTSTTTASSSSTAGINTTISTTHLPSPPFIPVPGVPNFRDLGGYPCLPLHSAPSKSTPSSVRRHYLYRSAQFTLITPEATSHLTTPPPTGLGITHIFDLRSQPEVSAQPTPLTIPGLTRVFSPVYKTEDYSPVALARKYRWYTSPETGADDHAPGFVHAYRDIAAHAGPAYSTICRHIIQHPDHPLIMHCTAGKDRTGVLAGLLLDLCGVDRPVIDWEYSITAAGLGPWREVIIKRLMAGGTHVGDRGDGENKGMTREAAERLGGSRPGNMAVFLQEVVDGEFGGVRGYFREVCGLEEGEIDRLRANLVVEGEGMVRPVDIPVVR